MATTKKVTRVQSTGTVDPGQQEWKPTSEGKSKATMFRVIALVLWLLAIGSECFAIFYLLKHMPDMFIGLIVTLVVDAILAIVGSLLWKKANRLDPARKADSIRFFVQNQLGAIISILAFVPLIILIFMNKDMDGKQKGIAGGIGIVLCLIAVLIGIDWNPPSVENYTEQTNIVVQINKARDVSDPENGYDNVFWTTSGHKYHVYDDCSAINKDATTEIFNGTVGTSYSKITINEPGLCQFCQNRATKEIQDKGGTLPAALSGTAGADSGNAASGAADDSSNGEASEGSSDAQDATVSDTSGVK